jgi:hypothetical protein
MSGQLQVPAVFVRGKALRHALNTRLCGFQKRSTYFGRNKNILALPEIELRMVMAGELCDTGALTHRAVSIRTAFAVTVRSPLKTRRVLI